MQAIYLADKSALARSNKQAVAEKIIPLLEQGKIATCYLIELEVLYSARARAEYPVMAAELAAFEHANLSSEVWRRALEVQAKLAEKSQHRIPVNDLLIAACAEFSDLTVLHYDADFDRIGAVTQQPVEWIVPRGTVD